MRKRDLTKESRIQDATAAIILKEGAAAVSTVKVAKRVGISQSNVYLYFKNKDDLLLSVYQREQARIQAAGDLNQLTDKTIALPVRLRLYMRGIFDYAVDHPDSLTLIQQIKFLMGQDDGNPLLATVQGTQNIVETLMQEAVDAGVIRNVPINVHMSLVFSMIHTHTLNLKRGLYQPADYSFETFYDLLWSGIKGPATD